MEIYDIDHATSRKSLGPELVAGGLGNISTRGFVSIGSDIVIAGFILGDGAESDVITVRGIGPSLAQSGVTNALVDPMLELRNGNGEVVGSNDNWKSGPPVSLPPADPAESAIELAL